MLRRQKKTASEANEKKTTKSLLPAEKIHELIKAKAYDLYCKRGSRPGDQTSDWLTAEKEVRRELRI